METIYTDDKRSLRKKMFNLLDYYKTNNIINKDNVSDFYWTFNSHHNVKGYQAMGNAIYEILKKNKLFKF